VPQPPPAGLHAQLELWQLLPQQSAPVLHELPTVPQGAQLPLRQMFEQHWLAKVQAELSSWQAAQVPR